MPFYFPLTRSIYYFLSFWKTSPSFFSCFLGSSVKSATPAPSWPESLLSCPFPDQLPTITSCWQFPIRDLKAEVDVSYCQLDLQLSHVHTLFSFPTHLTFPYSLSLRYPWSLQKILSSNCELSITMEQVLRSGENCLVLQERCCATGPQPKT